MAMPQVRSTTGENNMKSIENNLDIELIYRLSMSEKKKLLERFAKLSEENGELAQEILIASNAFGSQHKKAGKDGIVGEAVDVILVALSIFFCAGGSPEELAEIAKQKCAKWEAHQ
jgi:NTP pyrophosphatase (non-canonical NTP hydrolase)